MGWKNSIKTAFFIFIGWMGKSIYENKLETNILTAWDQGIKNFNWIRLSIIKVLNFELKIWWIIIIFTFFHIIKFLLTNRTSNLEKTDSFKIIEYTEDTIKGYKWKWSWIWIDFETRHSINSLTLECPECETNIEYDGSSNYSCPRCDKKFSTPHISNIKKLIRDNCIRKIEERE